LRLALDNYLENKTNILNDLMDKPYKEAEKQLYDAIEKRYLDLTDEISSL